MKSVGFFKTLVHSARMHVSHPRKGDVHSHHCENVKSSSK